MENKRIYAIYDRSAERFHALFDDINDVTAARHFHLKTKDLVFPAEFKLVCFGEFIPTTGAINLVPMYDVPVFVPPVEPNAKQYIKPLAEVNK